MDLFDFITLIGGLAFFLFGMNVLSEGLERLAGAGVENHSLSNLDSLVEVAAEMGYIKPEDKKTILEFRNNL